MSKSSSVGGLRRVFVGIALGVAVLLAAGTWLRLRALERDTLSGWRAALDGGAVTTRATIDDWYAERADDAQSLAGNLSRHAGTIGESSGGSAVSQLLAAARRRGRDVGTWILDENGVVLASATADTLSAPERAASEQVRRSGGTAVSPITLDDRGATTMAFAAAVPSTELATARDGMRPAAVVMRVTS